MIDHLGPFSEVTNEESTQENSEAKRKHSDGVYHDYMSTGSGVASSTWFQPAKRVGTVQNILILGTARAGKYTIAKHIATDLDSQDFPTQDSEKGIGVVHRYNYNEYNFVIIDTGGAHTISDPYVKHSIDCTTIKKDIEKYLADGINLILIVVRKDCCATEELADLNKIIENLFTKSSREYIALVHSGCENFEDDECKKYIETFRRDVGPAGKLSSYCRKGVCAVGFPDLKEIRKNYLQLYQESISISKIKIRRLVNDSKTIQPHVQLFNTKKIQVGGVNCVLI